MQPDNMNAVLRAFAKLQREGKPGNVFHCGSIGLQIAAAVIGEILGKTFKELFCERVAYPCEMIQANLDPASFLW